MPTPGSEERLVAAALAAAFGDAVVVLDDAGRVVAWNGAAEGRAGMAFGEGTGRPVAEVVPAAQLVAAVRIELAGGGAVLAWPAERLPGADDVARVQARILEHVAPGVAHDLVNQVGGIQGFVEVIDRSDARDRAMLRETAGRAMATVNALQGLTRTRPAGVSSLSPEGLITEAIGLCAHPLAEVVVTIDVPDGLHDVAGDRVRVRQGLLALLVSAMDALGWPAARGAIAISAAAIGGQVEIAIDDDGPGLGDDPERPFEASGGAPGGRVLLDIAVARHLLRLDGGDVSYVPRPDGGNRFVLSIPDADAGRSDDPGVRTASSGDASRAADRGGPAAAPAILVCDDEDSVRSLVVRVLARAGLATVEAASAEGALAVLEQRPVSVVLADHHLEAMSAPELYRIVVDMRPELAGRFILMSGDADAVGLATFAREHGLHVVAKPFTDLAGLAELVLDVAAT